MGAQVPSGHRSAPTEPAGETVSSQSDDGGGYWLCGALPRLGCRLGRFAAERHWRSLTPRHALRGAQPCLVAKSYRTLTKKSGTAEAIPDFFV